MEEETHRWINTIVEREKSVLRGRNLLLTDVVVRSSSKNPYNGADVQHVSTPNWLRYMLSRSNGEKMMILKHIKNLEKYENGNSRVYFLEK